MRQFALHAQARRSRHLWMATVETHIVRIAPRFAGKVDWDAATFHFNQGTNPAEAASLMLASAIVTEDAEITAQIEADEEEAAYLDAQADEAAYHDRLDREWTAAGRAFNWDGSDEAYEEYRDAKAERDADARQDR